MISGCREMTDRFMVSEYSAVTGGCRRLTCADIVDTEPKIFWLPVVKPIRLSWRCLMARLLSALQLLSVSAACPDVLTGVVAAFHDILFGIIIAFIYFATHAQNRPEPGQTFPELSVGVMIRNG